MRDPKAIRKAIMTAKSVATLIDPHFGRVPMPELGEFGRDKPVEEHSPLIHAAYDVPMPEHFAIGGPALSAYNAAKRADYDMPPEGGKAVENFIGVGPDALKTGAWGGIMRSDPLEDAYSEEPSEQGHLIRQQLHESFSPVREKLRDIFGDHVTLYRHQHDTEGHSRGHRNTLSWTIDPKVAEWFAGIRHKEKPLYSDEDIENAHQEFLKNGKVKIGRHTLVHNPESPYPEIWDDHEMVTDVDSVPEYMNWENESIKEDNDRIANKRARIKKAKVPLDDVIWASNRAGQREFIVHNRPDAPHYINEKGEMPNAEPEHFAIGGDVEGREGYDDGGGVLDTLGNLANQYVVQPAKDAASAVNRNVVQPVAKAFDENIAQPVANAFAPPPPPKPKVTVSLVGANSSFPEGTAPGYLDKRFHEIPFRAYRADAKNQFGGGEGIETLPIPSWKNNPGALYSLYNYARAAGAAQRYGYPTIDPRTLAAMGLKEGRSDYGFNGFKPQATPDTRFYQTLSENYNLSPDISEWLGMINYADRVSKKRNIPFTMVWNGTGTNAYGQTGAQYANSMQAYLDAVNHPKNKDYYRFIENAYKEGQRYGFAPKRKAKKAGGGEVDDGRDLNDFGLYSHAAEQAGTLARQDSPENYRDMLMKRGVKPAEIKWSGYDEAFADQPQISRDQLVEHFNKKMPDLYETQFGGEYDDAADALQERHAQEMRDRARELGLARLHGREHQGETLEEIQLRHQQERSELRRNSNSARAFHEDYTLPGGKNYREVLVQHNSFGGFKGVQGHFGQEPDIITSLRLKDRQDHEGAKVLHLEELQSDWGQKARKHGFRDDQRLMEAGLRYNNAHQAREEAIKSEDAYKIMEADKAREEAYREYRNAQQAVNEAAYIGKTDDWVDLGLKRALWEAAKGGYDKLAWSPGEVQADRYDLSRHIKEIHHENNDDGTYNLIAYGHDGEKVYDKDDLPEENLEELLGKEMAQKVVSGEGKSGKEEYDRHLMAKEAHDQFAEKVAELYANDEISREEFANHSDEDKEKFRNVIKKTVKRGFELGQGPKIAEEIGLSDEYLPIYNEFTESKEKMSEAPSYSPYRDWRVLSGLDLKVGGEGMHKFYNEMLPKRLKKLAKQHDPEANFVNSIVSHTSTHDPYENDPNWEPGDTNRDTNLPAIEITPKMRESILKRGFPAYAEGGEVDGHTVGNPMSIFPKPQRMWEEDMPGGAYLSMPDQEDVTGHKASSASIGIQEGGKPYFHASRDPAEVTGSPGRGSATVKTNLFKQKAGWKWLEAPEGHQGTNTLVSVEHRGKHHYVLHAHFPKGVDLARYPDAPSEPRLRPTTKGNVELGPQVGSISVRGKEHPVYAHAIVKSHGGEVDGFADGGFADIDEERFREYLKRIHSPLSSNPESVQKALQIASSYRAPIGHETGVGSLYSIKQSLPASAVTRTVKDIPGVKLKPIKKGSWEDFYDLAKDHEFVNVGGDLSGFGRLTHINGKPLAWPVDLHAGADYMREPNPGRVWANIGAHATGYRSKVEDAAKRGKELYGILSPMGASAVNSSHNMLDTLLAQIPNAGIDTKHLKEFDEAIKRGDHLGPKVKSNPKLFQGYLEKLEKWPGLENAKEVSDFARPSKGNLNGGHRADIVKFMDKSYWRDRGFPEVGVTRAAITNPDLMGVGGNKLGFRVVKLLNKEPSGGKLLFQHSTYPVNTFGEYVMDVPLVQRHYAQPDVIERMIKSPTKSGQVVHPYSEDPMGRSTARKLFEEQKQIQPVNQRFIDSVMQGMENQEKYGFKSGGTARKALMIAKSSKKK